jgi:hypothetical protein
VVFGIVVSIPIIVWGSTLVLKLMEKFPVIVTLGAALLGYIAGGMIFSDVAVQGWIAGFIGDTEFVLPGAAVHLSLPGLVGALGVVLTGLTLKRRKQERQKRPPERQGVCRPWGWPTRCRPGQALCQRARLQGMLEPCQRRSTTNLIALQFFRWYA